MSEDYYDLPELITLSEYDGNFNLYLEAIYELFKKDFIEKHPVFQGTRVGLKKASAERRERSDVLAHDFGGGK